MTHKLSSSYMFEITTTSWGSYCSLWTFLLQRYYFLWPPVLFCWDWRAPECYWTATRLRRNCPCGSVQEFGAQHKDLGTVKVARASAEVLLPQLGQLLEASWLGRWLLLNLRSVISLLWLKTGWIPCGLFSKGNRWWIVKEAGGSIPLHADAMFWA